MNPLSAIFNLFKKSEPSEDDKKWLDGYHAFQKGKELYHRNLRDRRDGSTTGWAPTKEQVQEALDCFDKAIELNFRDSWVYGLRAGCLQFLDFHLDAIDDLTKAITLEPNDCALYYQRSVSRMATGDLLGRVSDLQAAIRLATVPSTVIKAYDEEVKQRGWNCAADRFRWDLIDANLELDWQAEYERMQSKNPGSYVYDLVNRRRARSLRRAKH